MTAGSPAYANIVRRNIQIVRTNKAALL